MFQSHPRHTCSYWSGVTEGGVFPCLTGRGRHKRKLEKQKQTGIHIFRKDHLNKYVGMECSGTEARTGPVASQGRLSGGGQKEVGPVRRGRRINRRLVAQARQAFLCLEVSSFHQYKWKSPQVGSKLPKVRWSLAFEKVSLVLKTVRHCAK